MNQLWLIYILAFGSVLLAVQALYWLVFRSRRERKIINRRLALSRELSNSVEVLEALRSERGLYFLAGLPGGRSLDSLVVQTGLKLTPANVTIWLLGFAVLIYAPLAIWLHMGAVGLLPAIAGSLAIGYLLLRRARARRISRFSEQLPEALDIIVRGLRAGHPFRVALGLVAQEMADPIGTEFGVLLDEITFGLDQQKAVDHLFARVGQDDLAFLSIAINIQNKTGGNLAEILQNLSRLLRNRAKMRLKVRALTSEGRLSAVLMTAMPFVLFVIVSVMNPGYYGDVKDNPIIAPALVLAAFLLIVGNLAIHRMVNFKI